jgi:N-acetylglucosaminyl-diphospho-decaprenol L-rhamnosyltransferase
VTVALSIDVVVVAFNRYDLTERCLAHLAAQTVDHHTIVCDNGSTDGTLDRLREDWPSVETLRLDTNSAFSVACNRAVAAGSGEIVVLVNNDVECAPDFLEHLVEPLVTDPELGSVASLMLRPGRQLIDSFGAAADVTLASFPRLSGFPAASARRPPDVLVGPTGTAAAYRRVAWDQVGGLDERLFAYFEDFDLGLRLRAHGWTTAATMKAVGVHLGSATHGHRSSWQRYHAGFGRAYLLRRYRVLRGRHTARTIATEVIVVLGDLAISHDLAALRGRVAGWHAAARLAPHPPPPDRAIDVGIGLGASLARRRRAYGRGAV